ncbi:tRNA (adenosine(37)-N6)-dimethylallyltransferase MiaA [Croceicoccus sp. F390]|uniref:tRNA dimethylallyltransferase n=1 Tax=Croceicoccus esteveae TaxID=3075597 RepID=A0ABU2ZEQ2_9SPHN|nr:tRNA (adenosine(37)-N6)-dimethylallyltransferase MiaA [Croceicoccus sp. F390]MDT0575081.1 tRNA (adenosine(37)-N6)-dimethylallyltransferase MiaA [Croceicoccus sp. F390]
MSNVWHSAKDGGTKPPLALIAGPTASGKSEQAVRLALRLQDRGQPSIIINADSAQVYGDLRVLSARPSVHDMHGIEHRLFGTWDGAQACSAADWAAAARVEIARAHDAGALPILVGGTGLYLRSLLDGIAPVPQIEPAIRAQVRAMMTSAAHAALGNEDPAAARRLAPADTTRIMRALEVVRSTGRPLHAWQEKRSGGISEQVRLWPAILLPDRTALYARCETRFASMMDNGAIDEVRALLARRLDPALPIMRAIGVAAIATFLQQESDRETAITIGAQATRRYAKRQYTWFGNQTPAAWHFAGNNEAFDTALNDILLSRLLLT